MGVACLGGVAHAAPQSIPTMTIKIYNDDPKAYIFPVYTTGQHRDAKVLGDIWLQAIFGNTKQQILSGQFNYNSNQSFRFYLTDRAGLLPQAIPPKGSVSLTIPLYTQLVTNPSPAAWNQYADWWNGATIQLFYSSAPTPPPALVQDYLARPTQKPLVSQAPGAVFPTCVGCKGVKYVWDTSDLAKNAPSQLLEFTLGARVQLCPIGDCKDNDIPNTLDLSNVDFDVSYVNIAYGPAAMGPYENNQVGYVGTPQTFNQFSAAVTKFLQTPAYKGWPQFVITYPGGRKETINKLASPLEIFPRIAGGGAPPPDLTPLPSKQDGGDPSAWPKPESLWKPIKALYTNWIQWAGPVGSPGQCTAGDGKQFCDAIINAKTLLQANYDKYKGLFGPNKPCGDGTPVKLTDSLMVAHVYGWTPFTENGCPAGANLLEETPGYPDNHYAKYAAVKEQYDLLNYGRLQNIKYDFNPYVTFIHGSQYANIENAYAYSVDDAVGNVQAEGAGIIIDVGSTEHLENQTPAKPPINISYGLANGGVAFTKYSVCNDKNWKPTRSYFQSFIINANNPQNCPVYFEDDKKPEPQRYTFTITRDPSTFPEIPEPEKQIWTPDTAKPVFCEKNNDQPPYQKSSRQWCCDITAKAGIKAFSVPEAHSAHQSKIYYVVTQAPMTSVDIIPSIDKTCSEGTLWPPQQ